ncbi:MAG TPA: glycosyltransferase family 2 protein [Caulobacteraceae bacterium]|jgi:GT2 family glycosyltransferase
MAPRLIQALTHPAGALEIVYAGAEDDDVCLVQDESGLAIEVDAVWGRFGRDIGLNLIDHPGNARTPWALAEPGQGLRFGLDFGGRGDGLYLLETLKPAREPVAVAFRDPFTGAATPVQPRRRYRLQLAAAVEGTGADLVLLVRDREGRHLDTIRRRLPERQEGEAPDLCVDFETGPKAARLEIACARRAGDPEGKVWLGRPALGPAEGETRTDWSWARLPQAELKQARSGAGPAAMTRLRAPLPDHLLDGRERRLVARVLGYAGALEAALSFRRQPLVALSKAGLERASVVRLAGRAGERELPRLDLRFCVDGRLSERHRIKPKEGKFDARLPIPREWLDGRPHLIQVREAETQAVLFQVNRRTAAFHARWPVLQLHAQPPLSPESSPARAQHLRAFRAWTRRRRAGEQPPPLLDLHQEVLAGPRKRPVYPRLAMPQPDRPRASVIIPAHGKFEVTHLGLAALLFAPVRASFEVVLVDDGSSDETARIEEIVSGLRVVRHARAQGFVAACNHGAEQAQGEHLVFLNNDTEVTAGWLDELLAALEGERVGLAGAKLIYPDGRLQEAGGIVWGSGDPWNAGRGAEPDEPAWRYARDADYVSGAAIAVPRAVWRELGGFSPEFAPAYFEDTDFAMKVRASGRRVVYVPTAEVFHYEGQTAGVDKAEGAKRYQEVNRPKFKRKWRDLYGGRREVGDRPDLEKDRDVLFRVLLLSMKMPAEGSAEAGVLQGARALGGKPTLLPLDLRRRTSAEALERSGVECLSAPHLCDIPAFLAKSAADYDALLLTEPAAGETVRALLPEAVRERLLVAEPPSEGELTGWLRERLASVDVFGRPETELRRA